MEQGAAHTHDGRFKTRNFWVGLTLSCVTLGLYYYVWYYRLNDELKRAGKAKGEDTLARSNPTASLVAVLVGGFLVIPALISVYGFGQRIKRAQGVAGMASDDQISPTTAFLLWFPGGLLIVPAVAHCWYVTKHQNALLLALDTRSEVANPDSRPNRAEPSATAASSDIKRADGRGAKRSAAQDSTAPTFRVVALGPSGCGKTVFLASMFHRLNFSASDRHYKLEADAEQLVTLGQIYDELSDPANESWPAGTDQNLSEFLFDCVTSDQEGRAKPILRLSYLDYRGGLLTQGAEPGSTALVDLEDRIQTAHALLAVIDGLRVRQLLLGEPAGHAYFERKVRPMFALMERAACPIHFVVTKWDLVRDIGEAEHLDDSHSLDQIRVRLVRDALMKYEHIEGVVYKNRNKTVRLIPVSAVGAKFGALDADGNVVKRPDGRIRPTNVEVPLCAVLPDLFAQVEQMLDEPDKKAILSEDRGRRHQQAITAAATALAVVLGGVGTFGLASPGLSFLASDIMGLFVGWMGATPTAEKVRGKGKQKLDDAAVEEQLLRAAVMDDFKKTVQTMERALPDSVLSPAR